MANAKNGKGTVKGITNVSTSEKVFGIFNGIGAISAAFNYMLILLEVQDTLKQPPSAVVQMKKATAMATTVTLLVNLSLAVAGYAAYGNEVSSDVLQSFSGPSWALLIANFAVVFHMATAVLVFALPVFDAYESWIKLWLVRRAGQKIFAKDAGHDEDSSFSQTLEEKKAASADDQPESMDVNSSTKGDEGSDVSKTAIGHASSLEEGFRSLRSRLERSQSIVISSNFSHLAGFDHTHLPTIEEKLDSLQLGTLAGNFSIRRRHQQQRDSVTSDGNITEADMAHNKSSALHLNAAKLSEQIPSSMYVASVGLAVEEVPLNTEGVLIPWYIRIPLRIIYCMIFVAIAILVPGFLSIIGLVGAFTFFPLSVHFPISCYRSVFAEQMSSKFFDVLLNVLWVCMLVVSLVAIIGSIQTMTTE